LESLLARLRALAPNHPSSPHFGRTEQPRVREATATETSTAEAVGNTSPVPGEGQGRQRDNAGSAEMKASVDAVVVEQSGATDTTRPCEQAASGDRPLDNSEFAEHLEMVTTRLADAKDRGLDTDRLYTIPPDRKSWTKDRLVAQMEIIDDLYRNSGDAACDGEAVIAGGLGGAGKGTVLAKHAGIDTSKYLVIDPDRIKEQMARRGMIPEVEGLSPMERSVLVHEESSWISTNLAKRGYADRKNVIWDITMSDLKSAERRIDDLRAAGYGHVTGVFVDIPAEQSVQRALERYRAGMERYRNGEGQGGRYVPPKVILAQRTTDGQTVNRQVFEALKPRFDRWMVFDNSRDDETPVLTNSSDWENQ
jgi:predicted ABC-type ATPase